MKSTKLNPALKISLVVLLVLVGTLGYVWTTVEGVACTAAATPADLASWLNRCYLLEIVRRLAELVVGVISVAFITDILLRRVYLEEIRSVVEELWETRRGACGTWLYLFTCENQPDPIYGTFEVSKESGQQRTFGQAFNAGVPANSTGRRGLWQGVIEQSERSLRIYYDMVLQTIPAWGANCNQYYGRFDLMSRRPSLNAALSDDIYTGDVESRSSNLIIGRGTAMAVRLRNPEMLPASSDPTYYPTLQELVLKCLGTDVRPHDQRPPKSRKTAETKTSETKAA